MCVDPVTGIMLGGQLVSGIGGAIGATQSAKFQFQAYKLQSEEMQNQIKQAEAQAMIEEVQRRDEYLYLTSKNLASAASTGARSSSETFLAIEDANARNQRRDQQVADLNLASRKAQLQGQSAQHLMAADASLRQGRYEAIGVIGRTLLTTANNMPLLGNLSGGAASAGPRFDHSPKVSGNYSDIIINAAARA